MRIGANKKILAFLHIRKDMYPWIEEILSKEFFWLKKGLKNYCKVWGLNP